MLWEFCARTTRLAASWADCAAQPWGKYSIVVAGRVRFAHRDVVRNSPIGAPTPVCAERQGIRWSGRRQPSPRRPPGMGVARGPQDRRADRSPRDRRRHGRRGDATGSGSFPVALRRDRQADAVDRDQRCRRLPKSGPRPTCSRASGSRLRTSRAGRSRIAVRLTPPPPNDLRPRGTGRIDPSDEIEFRCTPGVSSSPTRTTLRSTSPCSPTARLTDTRCERGATFIRFDMMTVQWMEERLAARRQGGGGREAPEARTSGITLRENFGYAFTVSLSGGVVLLQPQVRGPLRHRRHGRERRSASPAAASARACWWAAPSPRRLDATDADHSARLGRAVHVMLAIVPIELQAVATLPSQTSRAGGRAPGGGGASPR